MDRERRRIADTESLGREIYLLQYLYASPDFHPICWCLTKESGFGRAEDLDGLAFYSEALRLRDALKMVGGWDIDRRLSFETKIWWYSVVLGSVQVGHGCGLI